MNSAERFGEDGPRRRNNVGFALQILQRCLALSPAAIHESLRRRLACLEGRLKKRSSAVRAGRVVGDSLQPFVEELTLGEATGEELEAHDESLLERATEAQTIAEFKADIAELRSLERIAKALHRSGDRHAADAPGVRTAPRASARCVGWGRRSSGRPAGGYEAGRCWHGACARLLPLRLL